MEFLAKGNSMFPTLKNNTLYKFDFSENIYEEDIILYAIDDLIICHRVVKIICSRNNKVFYKTKGDNCADYDPYIITNDMIIGKVDL